MSEIIAAPVPGDRPPVRDSWLGRRGGSAGVIGFIVFFVLSGVVVALGKGRLFVPSVVQPIAFNHKKHVQENGLECSACHQSFEKEAFSGVPSADICATCHAEPQGKSPEEARLVKLLQEGGALDWKPLFRQPPHVFYSHRRHVVIGKIECASCHGAIAATTTPPGHVTKLRMQDCVDCHRRRGASTDCTACHR